MGFLVFGFLTFMVAREATERHSQPRGLTHFTCFENRLLRLIFRLNPEAGKADRRFVRPGHSGTLFPKRQYTAFTKAARRNSRHRGKAASCGEPLQIPEQDLNQVPVGVKTSGDGGQDVTQPGEVRRAPR